MDIEAINNFALPGMTHFTLHTDPIWLFISTSCFAYSQPSIKTWRRLDFTNFLDWLSWVPFSYSVSSPFSFKLDENVQLTYLLQHKTFNLIWSARFNWLKILLHYVHILSWSCVLKLISKSFKIVNNTFEVFRFLILWISQSLRSYILNHSL